MLIIVLVTAQQRQATGRGFFAMFVPQLVQYSLHSRIFVSFRVFPYTPFNSHKFAQAQAPPRNQNRSNKSTAAIDLVVSVNGIVRIIRGNVDFNAGKVIP